MHRSVRDSLSRVGRWPRLLAATACLVLAGLSAVGAVHRTAAAAPAPVRTTPVVVAAHDLPAGHVLTVRDLAVAHWPRALRPPGAAARTVARVGSRLAGPLSAGEVVTSTRLVGASLTDGLATGLAAVPVTIAQAHAVDLLHAGGLVELLAAPQDDLGLDPTGETAGTGPVSEGSDDDGTGGAQRVSVVARRLLVLAVLPGRADDLTSADAAALVVAADPATTLDIARAQSDGLVLAVPVSP